MKATAPILLLLLLAAGCHRPAAPQAPTEPTTPTAAPQSPISTPQGPPPLTLTGTVVADPSRTSRVVAPMDGRVEGLHAMVGDEVRAGQLVARLGGRDAASLTIKRQQAETKLALAEQDLRLKQSLFDDGMVSERELAKAREKKTLAEATLTQLAEVAAADIRVPRGGIVLRRDVADGQYVQAGDLLMEVSDLRRVWVMADVYESDISRVSEGTSVDITTLARPDEHIAGRVDKVYAALDPDSKTVKLRVVLDNPDSHLLPGMFATVTLTPTNL